jgi:ubiquinone biosynthesis protein
MILHTENVGYDLLQEKRPPNTVGRIFATIRHLSGLILGGAYTNARQQMEKGHGWRLSVLFLRFILFFSLPFLNRQLIRQPFPIQFRRRLEMLGPTYVKLGQILSLREDLLPKEITDELKNLLDRLPALPFVRYRVLVEKSLNRNMAEMFRRIEPFPLGSASLAQTHRAILLTGDDVVVKLLKPNVRQTVIIDLRLLRLLGRLAELFLSRFQPKRLINEFSRYTLLEVDLLNEAANAEIFAANFKNDPDIRFPRVYRELSSQDVLCMEYFKGSKPQPSVTGRLSQSQLDRVIDLGVRATVNMIFRDGFFHADLHPGNLIIFDDSGIGFIDLGMVGRFDTEMRKRMLSYLYSLVNGDPANAARYLSAMMFPGNRKSNPDAFRRAVEDLNRRWLRSPNFSEFSLGQLILQSVALAGQYYIFYPGEIVLMVKALVTLEGVGHLMSPGLDIAAVARKHVRSVLIRQIDLAKLFRDGILVAPELIDIMTRFPLVFGEGMGYIDRQMKSKREGPLAELRATIFASFCLIAAALIVASDGPAWLSASLFVVAFLVGGYGFFAGR